MVRYIGVQPTTKISVTDDSSLNTQYLLFVSDEGPNQETKIKKSQTALSYVPSSGTLASAIFLGELTGNATTASTLQTTRTIGGVSFDGSANIDLPGVNIGGNQNTTGSAATLTTARTIGGVSFDGSANIDLPGVNIGGNQNTTGSAATLTTARTIGGVSFDGSANIDLPGVNIGGNQNTTGSAATLTTARTIGGVSFDGSANIDLPGVNIGGNQNTTGNAATATALQTARTIGGVSFNGTANINLPGVNIGGNQNTTGSAATLTTARTIGGVSFDGSANIDLPGVNIGGNQNTTGNAATATALQTARTIGGVSFNGTANINLPGVNIGGNQNTTGSAATLTTARTIGGVSFDGSANIDLPGVNIGGNQNTTGNAATATALQTARTIGGVSFNGTANINLPGVNIGGNQNTTGSAATLTTARTLWGQSFDGAANVTGNLTSVGNITGTGAITISAGGTNQNITLTPSGTGTVNASTFNATSTTNGGFQGISTDSAAVPSFTWTGDLDTGMYRAGADAIGFSTQGTEKMRITSAGNVGVGTSSPDERLHVIGGAKLDRGFAAANPRLYLDHDSATDDANYIQLNRGDAGLEVVSEDNVKIRTNNTERMRITSAGNVGIGTTSPASTLHVVGNFRTDNLRLDGNTLSSLNTNGNIALEPNGTGLVTTTRPVITTSFMRADGAQGYTFGGGGDSDGGMFSLADGQIELRTNNIARVTLNAAGQMVKTNTNNGSSGLLITGTQGAGFGERQLTVERTGGNGPGIGFHDPSASSAGVIKFWGPISTFEFRNFDDSLYVNAAANNFVSVSDYRLKSEIADLTLATNKALALRPRRFRWLADERSDVGFIAHEVQEVIPEAVFGAKDAMRSEGSPEYQGVNDRAIIAVLTGALQEVIAEVRSLKEDVAALKTGQRPI
jgi:hypothetical protein